MSKKSKKSPLFMYGIEITKPHSKEMYAHNDKVAEQMKAELIKALNEETNVTVGKEIIVDTFTGYSHTGYDEEEIMEEGFKAIENVANWQLHEEYSYLCQKGIVPKLKQSMLGHKPPFFVYYEETEVNGRSYIDTIREIAKGRLRWSNCSDQDGNTWKEPYVKCDNEGHAKSMEFPLKCNGVDAYVDCYEDDDGEGDGGRPIILQSWSVRIKNY
jgi:hypothetical protein